MTTTNQLLDKIPNATQRARSYGPDGSGRINWAVARDGFARAQTQVLGDYTTDVVLSAGPSASTIAVYNVQWTGGAVLVAGIHSFVASAADQDILAWGRSWALDGSAAVALSADGKTYWVAFVFVVVAGALELHAIFGDEADDASEVEVTNTQIKAALTAAGITDLETHVGLTVARVKIQRVAVDTIVQTYADATTDNLLAAERLGATNPLGA